jgi:GT2 family glycosyltransferase
MRISAIIPTFNRRERLAKVLAALDGQSVDPKALEVVVVDDGSRDGTCDWLETQRYRFELRVIRQENRGPAHARNTGVDAARGELSLFLDDDVVPTPVLLSEHLSCHDAEKDIVVIGPLASLDHYDQPWVAWEQAKVEGQYAAMERGDWEPTFRQFWTGNASVARKHVIEAGKFDPAFLRGEDVELGYRLAERGLKFRFNPRARGLHHAERSFESWENAHRSYGKLEVEMFGPRGEDALIGILAGNWSRLHPMVRMLTELCARNPPGYAAATALLRSCVRFGPLSQSRFVTNKALSALANLLYWHASLEQLGPDRGKEVRRRGEQLRRAHRAVLG